MNLNLSEDQLALQDSLRRFIAKEYPFAKRRALAAEQKASGFSPAAWKQLADLGVLALPFDEAYGGLGGSAVDTMVVMEELGRGLMLEPYLGTVVLCGGLINALGSPAQKDAMLPAIAGGELLLALAHDEGSGPDWPIATTAQASGDGYVLNGSKSVVLYGAQSPRLLVSARDGDGLSLFVVDSGAAGVTLEDHPLHDGTRAATLELANVNVGADARLGGAGLAAAAIARATDLAHAALCAEAVGAMTALNEITSDYLKTRKQFGVSLSEFQALKHRMVDMFIWAETARSSTLLATIRVAGGDVQAARWACAAARVQVGEAARFVSQQAVQLHGGMGVTDELVVGHYFKRLSCISVMFGDVDHHLAYVSDCLLTAAA